MKQAERRRVLVREWTERRDGRTVYVRRYRLERPVVLEVRVDNSQTYETEYQHVGTYGWVVAGVFAAGWNNWEVWAESDDGIHQREAKVLGRPAAERYARKMLRAAGYRVRRAQ